MTKQDWLNCVGPGWHDIVSPLIDLCEKEGIEIVQIKEKFGSLRFYTEGNSFVLDNAICVAEAVSETTCESCGQPGTIKGPGWLKCVCDKCYKPPV
jgi:hypothetical protein